MTSIVSYSGLESDIKRSEESAPLMLLVWVLGGATIAAEDITLFGAFDAGAAVAVN